MTQSEADLNAAAQALDGYAQALGIDPERASEIVLLKVLSKAIKELSAPAWYSLIENHHGDVAMYAHTYAQLKEAAAHSQ